MAYFPFFMDIFNREGLIIGGGMTALRKIEKLRPFGARLTVIAPEILPEIEAIAGLTLLHQPYSRESLENKFFVIAATNDRQLNHTISVQCQSLHIPVNVVDDRSACSFLFPALVNQGDLSIGISTGGASPSAAIYLKEQIQSILPNNFDSLLSYLDSLRDSVKKSVLSERRRAAFFSYLYTFCLENGWPMDEAVFQEELRRFAEEELQ